MSQLLRTGKVNMSVCEHRTFSGRLVLNLTLGGASVTLHSRAETRSKRRDTDWALNESRNLFLSWLSSVKLLC